jgi:hypothetical protein
LRNQQLLGNANESPINPHEQSPLHAQPSHPHAPDEGARMAAYRNFVDSQIRNAQMKFAVTPQSHGS